MNASFKPDMTHDSPPESNSKDTNANKSNKRSRTARACDFCRRKKAKCYGAPGQPCSSCISYGVTCEFTDGSKKRGPPKGSRYVDTLEKRIRKIESTLMNCGHYTVPTISSSSSSSSKEKNRRFIPYPKNKQEQGDTLDSVRFMGDMNELEIFRGVISEKEYYEVGGQKYRKVGNHYVEMVSPTDDPLEKRRFRGPPIPKTVTGINHWIYSMAGVDRYTSDRLMRIYFMNVHPLLPVINKKEFLRQYRDQADTYPSAELLNAIFGAAARFIEVESRRQKSMNAYPDLQCEAPENWHIRFFEQAHAIATINPPKSSVSIVQTTVIIHNTSGNVSASGSEGWLMSGSAIRMAQYFALNRDCDGWDIPEQEKETRKRIWWSLYISDRFQAANMGRPIGIYDEDNDVGYPDTFESWTEVLDEPTDEDDDALPRFPSATFRPESINGRVEIYVLFSQLIKLSEILGHILQALYTPRARMISHKYGWNEIVTRLDHELTEWRFGFPAELERIKHKDFDEIHGYFAPTIASFLLCYFGCLILLHRPFIERDTNNNDRPSYSSFRISTSAATRGTRIAERMSIRDFLMLPYCFNITPVLQFALIHIYNSRNPDGRISAPSKVYFRKTLELVTKIRSMSKRATQLYTVLEFIIDQMNILMDSEASSPNTTTTTTTKAGEEVKAEVLDEGSNGAAGITREKETNGPVGETWVAESGVPRKVSNVGRGVSPLQQQASSSSSSRASNATPTTVHVSTTIPAAVSSYPQQQQQPNSDLQSWDTVLDDTTYLPSYSASVLTADATGTYQPPSNGSEAYTIRQFGYDTRTCGPGELETILQNISSSSLPLPDTPLDPSNTHTTTTTTSSASSSSSSALPFVDLAAAAQQQQQPRSSTTRRSTAMTSSFPTPPPPLSTMTPIPPPPQHHHQHILPPPPSSSHQQHHDLQNAFRNDVNNPFSTVPVSLDMTEWGEWMQQVQLQWNNNTTNPSAY